ncbi:hypothetical protein ABIE13_002329 [Ottowia thiooxydans]|uniref:Uncharacterized protein n=1 Tax=Ottowia thiooxydans TaxID=219182 RepID=A0ABV2Q8M1_9BURK
MRCGLTGLTGFQHRFCQLGWVAYRRELLLVAVFLGVPSSCFGNSAFVGALNCQAGAWRSQGGYQDTGKLGSFELLGIRWGTRAIAQGCFPGSAKLQLGSSAFRRCPECQAGARRSQGDTRTPEWLSPRFRVAARSTQHAFATQGPSSEQQRKQYQAPLAKCRHGHSDARGDHMIKRGAALRRIVGVTAVACNDGVRA